MAEQIKAHPTASKILAPDSGEAEVSAFARDPETGVMLRCRFDWLRRPTRSGRLILGDYKTAHSADPDKFAKSAVDYGYVMQGPWYCDVATSIGLAGDDVRLVYIVQEKTAPYLVNVIQLDVTADRIGRLLNRRAIATFAECESTGHWPGYPPAINSVSLPYWYEIQFAEELS